MGMLPIRKIKTDRVALTSYYGKVFVIRSEEYKYNYSEWLNNNLMLASEDATNKKVSDPVSAEAFDNHFEAPRVYSILSHSFSGITIDGWVLNLDHRVRDALYGADMVKRFEVNGARLMGKHHDGRLLLVDSSNGLYAIDKDELTPLPSLEELAGLDTTKKPLEYTYLSLSKAKLPVGIVMAYYYGYDELLKDLKVTPRVIPAGNRYTLGEDEYAIVFADESHVFSRDNQLASMMLGGFVRYNDVLKQYPAHEFNKKNVYLNVIEGVRNGAVRHIRELDSFKSLFVDPVTKSLLEEMKEPTTVRGLLVRSTELLQKEIHQDEMDGAFMRFKRYERFAGMAYHHLVKAVKKHNSRGDQSRQAIEMGPYDVWKTLSQDPAVSIVEEINPIQDIKEREAVTYNGHGGRSATTMNKSTRVYHKNDFGSISEGTVDSGDVGINIYTSANPSITSVRGTTKPVSPGEVRPTELYSTAALLSPLSDKDDAKRVN